MNRLRDQFWWLAAALACLIIVLLIEKYRPPFWRFEAAPFLVGELYCGLKSVSYLFNRKDKR